MIPPEQVDEIIRATRIEEVIGEFVHLKKRGINFLGLCPFHNEKTPSFTVSPSKGIYKCFGCQKAGNAVGFLMDHLNLSYPEALRWLANKYHITIKEREISDEEKKSFSEKESLYIVLKFAGAFYSDMLFQSDEGRSVGLSYLYGRGLEEFIIREFGLGYAPDDKRAFTNRALKEQFRKTFLIKSGQCIYKPSSNNKDGGTVPENDNEINDFDLIDRFQGRIMFPIHDELGRILGFGGRTLSADKNTAKYVNSPDSIIYHKSNVLYGLYQAKKFIQKENTAILVEGYMDVITLHQNGIRNAVASSGTSLTEEQVRKLHRFCNKVIIAYDGDDAGKKAAERAVPMLLEEGLLVYRIGFPDHHDPDSFAKTFGRDALLDHFRTNAIDFLEYYINNHQELIQKGPIERASFISRMAKWISLIPDDIRRSVYVRELSKKLHLPEEVIHNEVSAQRKNFIKSKIVNEKTDLNFSSASSLPSSKSSEEISLLPIQHVDEVEILRLLLLYGNMMLDEAITDPISGTQSIRQIRFAEFVLNSLSYEQIMFSDPLHIKIFSLYYENFTEKGAPEIQYFLNFPDEDVRNFIIKHIISLHQVSEKWKNFGIQIPNEYAISEKAVKKSLLSLKEKILTQIIRALKEDLKNNSMNEAEKIILLDKIRKLEKERMGLNKILGRSGIKFIPE